MSRLVFAAVAFGLVATLAGAGCSGWRGRTADRAGAAVSPSGGVHGAEGSSASPRSSTGTAPGDAIACEPENAPCCGDWDCAQQQRFAAATAMLRAQPGYLGIVVRDRGTGATWTAGSFDRQIWAGSTPKLAMAADLLERARGGVITLDATARKHIAAMLSVSDNDAADALWDRYNGIGMVSRFQRTFGMAHTGFVTGFPKRWGFIKTTAADLNTLMGYILGRLDTADRAYLVDAMRHVGPIQRWGVWAAGAALRPGVKNGWSIEKDDGTMHWIAATVGFAGPGERYTVSAMYHLPPGSGTIDSGAHALSDLIATVFGARVPAQITVPDPATGY